MPEGGLGLSNGYLRDLGMGSACVQVASRASLRGSVLVHVHAGRGANEWIGLWRLVLQLSCAVYCSP